MKRRQRVGSLLFRIASIASAAMPILIFLVILVVLFRDAWPAFQYQGFSFFTGIAWNMGNQYANNPIVHNGVKAMPGANFGILPLLAGTLGSSLIAVVVGVPMAVLTAVILVYKTPAWLSRILSPMVELLAGIPSVVFGLWGVVVLAGFVQGNLGPWLVHLGRLIPFLAGPVGTGLGLLTSGLVLAIMIVPIVAATTRDLLEQVPKLPMEGGLALGMTSYEVVRHIALPWVRRGVFGAVILGWGRAIGETMAVLMVSGNAANYLPQNLYSPISTMAATIAALLDSALQDASGMAVRALALVALTLLVITLVTNLLARLLVSIGARDVGMEV